MKTAQHIVSKQGILSVAAILYTIAFVLACTAACMSFDQAVATFPLADTNGGTVVTWIFAGVLGRIPSTVGTLQSLTLFIGYVIAPCVVLVMIAAKHYMQRRHSVVSAS